MTRDTRDRRRIARGARFDLLIIARVGIDWIHSFSQFIDEFRRSRVAEASQRAGESGARRWVYLWVRVHDESRAIAV